MARAALEATKETPKSCCTWTLRCTSGHAPRFELFLTNRPRAKEEIKILLEKLHASSFHCEEGVQKRSAFPLPRSPQADVKTLPLASISILPSRKLDNVKPLFEIAGASRKLDGVFSEEYHVEDDKLEEDPLKSDVTTKTSPVTSSPVSNVSPDLVEVNEGSPGESQGKRGRNKMLHAGRAPNDYVSSSDDEPEEITSVDDYLISDDSDYMHAVSLLDIPYEGGELLQEKPSAMKFELVGRVDHGPFFCCVDQWKIQIFVDREPTISVRSPSKPYTGQPVLDGNWIRLVKPRKGYIKHLKVVLAAAHLLTFVKKHPEESKSAAWEHIRKQTSQYHFKRPLTELHLETAFPLLRKLVSSDVELERAPIIKEFFPTLYKPGESSEDKSSGSRGQRSTSTESTKRKRPSTDNSQSAGSQKSNAQKKLCSAGKTDGFPDLSPNLNEEWVDEPDVCMFCDDGVEEGDRLLCCDGGCMRSFHVSKRSGQGSKCESLNLPESVLKADGFICDNCKYKQHQCFACSKLGRSSKTATEPQEVSTVFCCSGERCRRFYHLDCVSRLLGQEDLDPGKFVCPLHKCHKCGLGPTKKAILIKCRRCPRAWHRKCLNARVNENLWLIGDKYVLYCDQHELDPILCTPRRDHIVFPPGFPPNKGP